MTTSMTVSKRVAAVAAIGLAVAVGVSANAHAQTPVPHPASESQPQGFQEEKGWYVGLSAGPQARKQSTDFGIGTAAVFSNGFGISADIGYKFAMGIRVEGELGYQNNKNQKFIYDINSGASQPSKGNVGLRAFMANVYYDVPLHSRYTPYVGVGLGVYQSSINGFTSPALLSGVPGAFPPTVISTASLETFATQFRAGLNIAASQKTTLFVGYRYFAGRLLSFDTIGFGPFVLPDGSLTSQALDVTGGKTNGFEAGFRAHF